MNQKNMQVPCMEEDTVDLRELWQKLIKRKLMVIGITGVITALAVVYALIMTPWYEARAFIEIGTYKEDGKETLLDDGNKLSKRLQVEYVDILNNVKGRDAKVTGVTLLKKNKAFLEVKALGKSNELASKEVEKVIEEIETEHLKLVEEIKERSEAELNEIKRRIHRVETNELTRLKEELVYAKMVSLPKLREKLLVVQKSMQNNQKQIESVSKNIRKIEEKNPSLTALNVMERGVLEQKISQQEIQIIDIQTSIKGLENKTIKQLERKIRITIKDELAKLHELESLALQALKPHNFKNSGLVGEIILNEYPVKPKKKLIVIVAFITGLMLSVFLAFFLEFIKTPRKEESLE